MARVKGSAVKASIEYLRNELSEGDFQRLQGELRPEDAKILFDPIIQSSWYELSLIFRLMEAAERYVQLPPGRTLGWEMGRASVEYGMKTIYKVFFKVMDIHLIVKKAPQVLSTYYDSGSLEVIRAEDNRAVIHMTGFDQPDSRLCDRILGGMQRMAELAGGTDVVMTHPRCMAKGDPLCEYHGHWK